MCPVSLRFDSLFSDRTNSMVVMIQVVAAKLKVGSVLITDDGTLGSMIGLRFGVGAATMAAVTDVLP